MRSSQLVCVSSCSWTDPVSRLGRLYSFMTGLAECCLHLQQISQQRICRRSNQRAGESGSTTSFCGAFGNTGDLDLQAIQVTTHAEADNMIAKLQRTLGPGRSGPSAFLYVRFKQRKDSFASCNSGWHLHLPLLLPRHLHPDFLPWLEAEFPHVCACDFFARGQRFVIVKDSLI